MKAVTIKPREPYMKLPLEFRERLAEIIPDKVHKVFNVFTQGRDTTIRTNTLKISPLELKEKLENAHIKILDVKWNKNAFIIKDSLRTLQELPLYQNGFFYVQSLSSQVPPLVLNPKKDTKVLDICAAPGSKTTQIASLMGNTGEILANDINHIRLLKLSANVKTQGVTNVLTSHFPAQSLWTHFPEYFDYTLVDVPCSGEGRFYIHEPKSFAGWSQKNVEKLAKQAKWILRSAVSATKVGGRIVYSTCTLSPEENEEAVEWIMEKEKGALEVEYIHIPGLDTYPALRGWNGKQFLPDISKTIRILPSKTMEGFYVASLRKVRSNIPENNG